MREIIDELAFNPDTDFKLFLNNLFQSLNKQNYDEEQLSLFGEGQGSGPVVMNNE
ncbi:MAG: hypothetical protein WAU12_01145 [Saprospiraceae bacterium]|nr:hypothetical protein [Saprospiraceae bacterium]